MVTTTSTTATPTPTPTPTAASITQNAAQALLTSLNSGSGVDTATLVTSLVQAQFANKTAQLTAKSATLTAQISGISSLKSAITGFSTAFDSLVTGGTLATQPTSSNTGVLTATALPGAKLAGMSASITVDQLAAAQSTRTTTKDIPRTQSIGTGTMTLSIGTVANDADGNAIGLDGTKSLKTFSIDVGSGSLDAVAAAVNAAKSGVTASVVTDSDGSAYLSLKGATGAAQAFTLTADTSGSALAALNTGPGVVNDETAVTAQSKDAKLTVDGIAVSRGTNSISDLVTGVKLDLASVSTVPVTLGTTSPATALTQAVTDLVDTYNQVLAAITKETDSKTGSLKSDAAATTLLKSLKSLTLKSLIPGGGSPSTLAEIGVATNRDGTLRLDSATLKKALTSSPGAIEAMFTPSATNAVGLSSVLKSISIAATSTTLGLGASEARYTKAEGDVSEAQDKISLQSDQLTTRLTQQYASMNSRVSAYKSTQAFLTNQIAAWNKPT